MSTTKWRGRSIQSIVDHAFPRRPSLSPTPIPSSPVDEHSTWRLENSQSNGSYMHGLGLSRTTLAYEDSEDGYPSRLYIDQTGGAHVVGSNSRSKRNHNAKSTHYPRAQTGGRNSKSNKRKNHTRSGSTIDDLADAAIATSPRFSATSPPQQYCGSPSLYAHARPVTSYVNGYSFGDPLTDRPAKRIRSQRQPSVERHLTDGRPRTSHTTEYQSPRPEEAELLLGLRYAWGAQASPSMPAAVLRADDQQQRAPPVPKSNCIPTRSDWPTEQTDGTQEALVVDPTLSHLKENGKVVEEVAMDPLQLELDGTAGKGAEVAVSTNDNITSTSDAQPQTTDVPAASSGYSNEKTIEKPEDTPAPSATTSIPTPKKPRKIQPEIQAEVCSTCLKLQRDGNDEDNTTQWIGCEHCKKWFHTACAGFKDKQEARSVDKFYCGDCNGAFGTTTFVRKSSRARTAIDYAGLNEGVVKPSDESSMHHYIQPIKDGRIKYQQDDFARIRPELMTAEFWESMDGMKRPFVVPACWNPRFGVASDSDSIAVDSINAEPIEDERIACFNSEGEELSQPLQLANPSEQADRSSHTNTEVIDTDQDYLDMVMPRNLTVRRVAELYGPEQPVPVIDVKSQETKGQFTLADWANYYEQQGEKPIRNVISLEVSNSRLGRLIRRPKVVRDIDLEDYVWDNESRSTSNKRPVQFYCLMSVADSYTDFHIDFGGSSVYYHILKGVKTFFFIPPEDRYLKKYEEWCNSATQNETWLGDLCGGNVTRVDLHEGDTAFIPAGWIHSVWTPEDSLVIGGNFLTRLDYELQLKVANIEKTTRVPLMFRYPFFQKVMWYSLLKYLQDDPVPEEVLREFHEDDDYRYLRANPIYMDPDDLIRTAEPGTSEFNARIYPRSELKGLPALRDYLYRTARIYADLPVPDINKRQIDAVKGSIPKGHGDPMQLIKTFAVWCAWKAGNEKVPEWVHNDFGGLLPELKEREKIRKAESFRLPPERVSTRKSKDQANGSISSEPASPDSKSLKSPESDDSAKKRNDPKSSGARIACEACRKRRIKCRHKDGDDSPSGTSPAAIRPRTYSNVSTEIPKLASASPVISAHEQNTKVGATVPDFNNADLAQAALASLHSQSSDPSLQPQTTIPNGSVKKGRSKACEECRKSKRRCVHDEYGRVDPAKAAEPSKPRGSANAKRAARISDDTPIRTLKLEPEIDPLLTALSQPEITDAMIDPALMGEGFGSNLLHDQSFDPLSATAPSYSALEGDPALADDAQVPQNADLEDHHQFPVESIQHAEAFEIATDIFTEENTRHDSPVHDTSYSPITVDDMNPTGEMDLAASIHESQNARFDHASRFLQQSEQQMPQDNEPVSKASQELSKSEQRASSENSGQSRASLSKSRRSSSNTSNTTHQTAAFLAKTTVARESPGRPASRDSAAVSEADADEKLARELQAAENGLRRRTSVRA